MSAAVTIVNNALRKIGEPKMPVQYEEAVKALDACLAIDEAKYWSDKADALAAWAKIYRNDVAGRRAKQLKLHAYRRMGALAEELRPRKFLGRNKGQQPGPVSLLTENGLRHSDATSATRLARISKTTFDKIVARDKPPAPTVAARTRNGSDTWNVLVAPGLGLIQSRSFFRRHKPSELARDLVGDEVEKAREIATECAEWLDEFLQHLPKQKRR